MAVSSGVFASETEFKTDGVTWNIPRSDKVTNNVTGVHSNNLIDSFEVAYYGTEGSPPLGWNISFSTAEVLNTPTGSTIKVTLRLGPYLYKDYVAYLDPELRGNALIDNRYNSEADIDWLISRLTRTEEESRKYLDTKEEVGYVEIHLQAVEHRLELVGSSTGDQLVRTGNVEEKIYTFGLRNAREAILKAKDNWFIN